MSRKELHRPGLLKAACAGRITTRQLAEALRMSLRQARRLKRRFEAAGATGLTHRSRGRPSPRRLALATRDEVMRLMTTVYAGFNDSHMTEKLREQHGLRVSRESVRRVRQHLGLAPQRARQAPQARRRRVPEAARGALVQIDGSPFAWLEARGPDLMLIGAIDDATGDILALYFRPAEDVHGYATLFQHLFTTHGLPLALYGDGLNLLVRNDGHWSLDEQLAGRQAPTHLGTMLQALGVGYLRARSPQAKGRIERLWATLQDRLVSELRLRAIATVEAAHTYLPEFIADFNRRFGRAPVDPQPVWRRPPRDLPLVLGCRYRRVVARDNTVRLGPRWVQLRGAALVCRRPRRAARTARRPLGGPARRPPPRRNGATARRLRAQASAVARGRAARLTRPPDTLGRATGSHHAQDAHGPPRLALASMGHRQKSRHPSARATHRADIFT